MWMRKLLRGVIPKQEKIPRADKFLWSDTDVEFGTPLSEDEMKQLRKPKPKAKKQNRHVH